MKKKYRAPCDGCLLINYVSFPGPKYWGVLNPLWKLCSIGKRQSPIDIDPDKLLFDPFLKNLHIDKDKVRIKNDFFTSVYVRSQVLYYRVGVFISGSYTERPMEIYTKRYNPIKAHI